MRIKLRLMINDSLMKMGWHHHLYYLGLFRDGMQRIDGSSFSRDWASAHHERKWSAKVFLMLLLPLCKFNWNTNTARMSDATERSLVVMTICSSAKFSCKNNYVCIHFLNWNLPFTPTQYLIIKAFFQLISF